MKNTLRVTTPSDREIVITRVFDAPRLLVWDAMSKPELLKRWMFAPPGWVMTACEEDPRPGGSFRWAWNGSDGKPVMTMRGVYREVVPPKPDGTGGRAVRTESFEMGCASQMGEQVCTLTLSEQRGPGGAGGARTTLTLTIVYPSKEARDATIASGMDQGMAAGYDQLDAMLAASAA